MLGRDGDHLVLADAYSPGSGLTLVDVTSRTLTAVRVSGKQSDASGVYLVRGTVCFTRDSGGVSAVSPRTGRTLRDSNSSVERPGPPTGSATRVYFRRPLTLVGDALYVPYGDRSVYTVDVRDL
ncbi:hypothetical protein PV963_15450 [Streptomyces coeruleorubidus]|uniref:hypothetical protein n=1 Tax=Streptomyces coeruleorubidus TaxID=116188 RepID=UPI00237FA5CB|nr:hypothetical protein [Streptomyces coeruleorubidus]WDV51671.1 hypothetical protein PV963_15450 [Streptomyces coeruleorubidus]